MPLQIYHADVTWKGEHMGEVRLGNGPVMPFSAPPDAHGREGVLTPEDAFVAAANTCVMMMFIWACERFKIDLVSYECQGEGTKRIDLDRTELFTDVVLRPRIVVRSGDAKRVDRALQSAVKYSLVANSIKSHLTVDPTVIIEGEERTTLTIKILGSGCTNCQRLHDTAVQAAQMLGIEANFEKVTDFTEIVKYRALAMPALVVNEKVVLAGRVPNQAEMITVLTTALSETPSE